MHYTFKKLFSLPSLLTLMVLMVVVAVALAAPAPVAKLSSGSSDKGVEWPDPRFINHNNGTVTDRLTGLMWMKTTNCIGVFHSTYDNDNISGDGAVNYEHATNFTTLLNNGVYDCNCTGSGIYNDWRIPNIRELYSPYDPSQAFPSLGSGHPFTHAVMGNDWYYWSSTNYIYVALTKVGMNMSGEISNIGMFGDYYVWLVRGVSKMNAVIIPMF